MDDDSNDPRLHKILQLVLQLTNRPRLPHEDDIDCILEGLLTFTEQREQINPERLPLALFQESVDRAADAVFWITADAAFLYVNQQACHLLGYPREELLKLRLWDINLTCSEEHWKSSWQQSQSSTEPLETFYRRQDGSIFPVEVSSTHLWYGGSELQIAVVHDLTERSQRIAELRESEKRYRALIESQVDLISRYRADSILTFVNDAYCEFFGKTREELIGNTYLFMVAPEYREATMKDTADMVNNPRPTVGEYINYRHNGEECWIQWVVQGVPDDTGQITELQAVGRDITRLKQAESALRESEFFLQKSQSVGRVGSYYFDIQAGTWIDSPMLDEIFGIDESFPKTMEGWISLIHPDDQE
ncbi:MAG: PAS domain-containing protein, partial [Anaerolineae bacterium]|nr:PAS domain-containing protein [Anaerolineae bacterium]